MDINKIREAVNLNLPDELIELHVITILAADTNLIPMLLDLLAAERKLKNNAISDANLVIWKSKLGLNNKKMNKDNFIQKEIEGLYEKYKGIFFDLFPPSENIKKENLKSPTLSATTFRRRHKR